MASDDEYMDRSEKKKMAELVRELKKDDDSNDGYDTLLDSFCFVLKILILNVSLIFFLRKKEEDRLNWMYKKPSELIDREEYLLGRAIDKSFDLINGDLGGKSDICKNELLTCYLISLNCTLDCFLFLQLMCRLEFYQNPTAKSKWILLKKFMRIHCMQSNKKKWKLGKNY